MRWIGPLIALLARLTEWLDRYLRRIDYEARQKKRDDAADNPGGAFADHFGGRVRDDGNAAETDKTDP
ncbi:MAG: hypothetical protein WC322_02315 [Candidatus Paceibacterota bacterium]|jgi:hypothetical protein